VHLSFVQGDPFFFSLVFKYALDCIRAPCNKLSKLKICCARLSILFSQIVIQWTNSCQPRFDVNLLISLFSRSVNSYLSTVSHPTAGKHHDYTHEYLLMLLFSHQAFQILFRSFIIWIFKRHLSGFASENEDCQWSYFLSVPSRIT